MFGQKTGRSAVGSGFEREKNIKRKLKRSVCVAIAFAANRSWTSRTGPQRYTIIFRLYILLSSIRII